MTATTRRRLVVCLVVIAVLAPVETILLRAISTPDTKTAIQAWVGGLSSEELGEAAGEIQYYPLAYRKEIMRALTPAQRSAVWRDHLQGYLASRPDLDPNAVIAIDAASALMAPQAFEGPSRAVRTQIGIVAAQLVEFLGRDETEYLLYRLGPADGTFASLEPLSERFANYVRQVMVAVARQDDCQCSTSFGCGDQFTYCTSEVSCTPDEDWPMCGWGWFEECDGVCRAGWGPPGRP